jgi:hypothetical protein
MVNACNISNKGFMIFDYDTRATNAGFSHEVATGEPGPKKGAGVSAIDSTPNIIGDHWDTLYKLFIGAHTITTGTFSKQLVSSNIELPEINYIQRTSLVMAVSWNAPYNVEIHDTNSAAGSSSNNIKTNVITSNRNY